MLLHLIKNVELSSKYQPYSLRARAFAPAELAILREQPVGALVLPVRPAGRRGEEQGDLLRGGRSLAYGFGTVGVGNRRLLRLGLERLLPPLRVERSLL